MVKHWLLAVFLLCCKNSRLSEMWQEINFDIFWLLVYLVDISLMCGCMWFIVLYNRISKDLDSPTRSIPVFGRPVRPETHGWGYAQPGILPRMGAVPATRQVGTRPIIHVFGLGDGLKVQKAYQKPDTGTSGKGVACDPTYLLVACDPTYLVG